MKTCAGRRLKSSNWKPNQSQILPPSVAPTMATAGAATLDLFIKLCGGDRREFTPQMHNYRSSRNACRFAVVGHTYADMLTSRQCCEFPSVTTTPFYKQIQRSCACSCHRWRDERRKNLALIRLSIRRFQPTTCTCLHSEYRLLPNHLEQTDNAISTKLTSHRYCEFLSSSTAKSIKQFSVTALAVAMAGGEGIGKIKVVTGYQLDYVVQHQAFGLHKSTRPRNLVLWNHMPNMGHILLQSIGQ